jgi:hypothetical protein
MDGLRLLIAHLEVGVGGPTSAARPMLRPKIENVTTLALQSWIQYALTLSSSLSVRGLPLIMSCTGHIWVRKRDVRGDFERENDRTPELLGAAINDLDETNVEPRR